MPWPDRLPQVDEQDRQSVAALLHLLDRRRPHEQQQQIGVLRAGDEHLLAVDDVAVALADGHRLQLRRVRAGRRFGDAERLQAKLADAQSSADTARFCSSDPCRSSVPIMYICAWHAPALAPQRLISSRMIAASVMPRPDAAVLFGNERGEVARVGQRPDEVLGIRAPRVEVAPVGVGKRLAQLANGRSKILMELVASHAALMISEYHVRSVPVLADVIVRRLRRPDVRTLFGVPGGGGNLDLIEAAGRAGLPFVLTATETGGALAALAQAEVTGRPGACLTTLGPGAASVVNGVACALLDRAPDLVFTDSHAASARAFQHQQFDHPALFAPITKWSAA